jgi:hypothetical protein
MPKLERPAPADTVVEVISKTLDGRQVTDWCPWSDADTDMLNAKELQLDEVREQYEADMHALFTIMLNSISNNYQNEWSSSISVTEKKELQKSMDAHKLLNLIRELQRVTDREMTPVHRYNLENLVWRSRDT